ncbi:hypothetical protein R75461_08252 [Paraburkholderia nemoris]|nr:hypothetical protein R75461_08252 [Paraburkholderia nemoris]
MAPVRRDFRMAREGLLAGTARALGSNVLVRHFTHTVHCLSPLPFALPDRGPRVAMHVSRKRRIAAS